MPLIMFANALNPQMSLPEGMILKSYSDTLLMPRFNLKESSTAGMRLKRYTGMIDLSLSNIRGDDGLTVSTLNTFIPVDLTGGMNIKTQLVF